MIFRFRYFSLCFALLCLFSCSSRQLVGSWDFIEVYKGVVTRIDTLKNKENLSRYGNGILTFHNDQSFESKDLKGYYLNKNNLLKMKYSGDEDTIQMKISYISKEYLLLSSTSKIPNTWFYKRITFPKAKK